MKEKIYVLGSTFGLLLTFAYFNSVAAQIRGKVIDADGNPVKEIFVELIPAGLQSRPSRFEIFDDSTEEDGSFEFEGITEGKYILAVGYIWTPDIEDPYPTAFYPNARDKSGALIFEIAPASKEQNVVFQLPEKLPTLNIHGKILMPNGKPAQDAHVRLHNEDSNLVVSDCRTDDNGNFFLKGFVGGRYHIEADNYKIMLDNWDSASSSQFILKRNMKEFRLIMTSMKDRMKN